MLIKILFFSSLVMISITGCNNAVDAEKARQDSIAEAAAADSMLQDALSSDTAVDALKADTLNADTLN